MAIVGPTGSGKSTLINLLFKFYQTDYRGNQPWRHTSLGIHQYQQAAGRKSAVVMQEMLILQDSLLNNIRLDTGKSEQEIEELIQTGTTE